MSNSSDSPERRKFLSGVVATIQAAIGGTLGVILGGSILSPGFARRNENWLDAGRLADLADEIPTPVTLRVARQDGYSQVVERQVVFLVKSGSDVKALSSTCTHLGCRVSWQPDTQQLLCPCHGGVYDKAGAVVDGPPPEPLAVLPTRVEGSQVMVQV
ncbi:MAG: Rieske 2Fe-2S domain-containing protein [Acidobacteria bacterium]|nr:Rieske 2Fe-2S domain-containing protein [Acidobacteriota bacterium]